MKKQSKKNNPTESVGKIKKSISNHLVGIGRELGNWDKSDAEIAKSRCAIGKHALEIRNLLRKLPAKGRPSFKSIVAERFVGKAVQRINEAISSYGAVESGVPEEAPLTTILKLGQALKSKNLVLKEAAEEIVRRGKIAVDGNEMAIEDAGVKDVVNALRQVAGKALKSKAKKPHGKSEPESDSESTSETTENPSLPKLKSQLESTKGLLEVATKRRNRVRLKKLDKGQLAEIQQLANDILNLALKLMGGSANEGAVRSEEEEE